ncbi:hypothetical protein EJ03DRAFT_345473 [Teratosphaeria nubilosa]|uniref:Cytoplasmic tRNA 2-thiolation protein 2 n=1 Tax=Teratosphaeria nubilosa TaxID=161662 RepID=A0A6G1KZQ3_9PEZI|nr:hypothetical protein EJ03DRAFT_345473 [Teratosphaeria nubilosa]
MAKTSGEDNDIRTKTRQVNGQLSICESDARTLLLPLSYGAGSTALLHVLSQHLKGQVERTGRTGFKIHVLHVLLPGEEADSAVLEGVQSRYREHSYTTCALDEVLNVDDISLALLSLDSATSREDATIILLRKLVVAKATALNCEAILWGDSTTKLAERTLSETAKGRGSSLPWVVADGESLHGVAFYYPMQELLTKELIAFAALVDPPISDLLATVEIRPVVNTKNTTIDELMKQYFASVEQEYPSIVANVVKTSGKLKAQTLAEVEMQCEMCDIPLDGHAPEKSRLCNGCVRTLTVG